MADKNLHDIKIDELDSPKKTPIKNILTLLALLFIIGAISVVITKLILGTGEGDEVDLNSSSTVISTEVSSDDDADKNKNAAAEANSSIAVPVLSSAIPDRNLTSITKDTLRSHTPKKEVKEVKEVKKPKTYKAPKHVKSTTSTKKPTKQYIDKTVVKKHVTPKKKASYLGGKLKPVTNSYYIKVGTYRDTSVILAKVKKNNFNYSLVKLKDDKTMTRVFVGPFFSENEAQKSMSKVRANILSGAYITKVK